MSPLLINYCNYTHIQTTRTSTTLSEFVINNQSIKSKISINPCLDMNTADPFADTDPEDMAVDAVQRQLDAARVSSISLPTSSTLVPTRHSASSGSEATTGAFSSGTRAGQHSTTLSAQIRKLKNAATAPRILGGGTIIRTSNYGSLTNEDGTDNRHKLTHLRELYDKKLNVATSFDPASLSCSN